MRLFTFNVVSPNSNTFSLTHFPVFSDRNRQDRPTCRKPDFLCWNPDFRIPLSVAQTAPVKVKSVLIKPEKNRLKRMCPPGIARIAA